MDTDISPNFIKLKMAKMTSKYIKKKSLKGYTPTTGSFGPGGSGVLVYGCVFFGSGEQQASFYSI